MASTTGDALSPGDPPGGPRKRPAPPTIDLPAAEVASAVQSEQPAADDAPDPTAADDRIDAEPAPARPGRASLWSSLLAGIAGAVLVAAIVAGLWAAGVFARRDDPSGTFALRLALIESQLRQLGERSAGGADARQLSELSARLAAAEQAMRRLDDISARLGTGEQAARRLDEVAGRIAAAEQGLRPLDDLAGRLAKLEGARPAAADPAMIDRLSAAEAAAKTLTERLAAAGTAEKAVAERVTALEAAARGLADRDAELSQRVDQAGAVARDAGRQASLASEEATRAETAAADRAMRLAFVAARLRDTVDRGEPFAAALAAAKSLAPDKAALAPLEPFATTGVPSNAALARELAALVPAMQAVAAPPARNSGMLDRLRADAERLVRIRRIVETPGDDPSAVVGRIEAQAARGDVAAALAELPKLPANVRAPADAWIKKAETRRAALDVTGRLAADALAALGKVSP
jgi:hypothetical protein